MKNEIAYRSYRGLAGDEHTLLTAYVVGDEKISVSMLYNEWTLFGFGISYRRAKKKLAKQLKRMIVIVDKFQIKERPVMLHIGTKADKKDFAELAKLINGDSNV